jgi:hypothetical protein
MTLVIDKETKFPVLHTYTFTSKGAIDSAKTMDSKGKRTDVHGLNTLPKEGVDLARKVWQRSFGGGPSAKTNYGKG